MTDIGNELREIVGFLSSPSDMQAEQAVVLEEVQSLVGRHVATTKSTLRIIRWPDDISAGAGDYAQSVINEQSQSYDIFIGLVGARMGSPTPRADSGTEEEFDRAIELAFGGRPMQILLFFSNLPKPLNTIDPHQLMLVRYFKEKAGRLGILSHTYNSLEEFRRLLSLSLEKAYLAASAIREFPHLGASRDLRRPTTADVQTVSFGDIRLAKKLLRNGQTIVRSAWRHIAVHWFA